MYLILCILVLGGYRVFITTTNYYNIDKKATVPLRGLLAIMIIINHIALVCDLQKITPPIWL